MKNVRISNKFSLKFVPKGLINNNTALVQMMAWRRQGEKPLSDPMMGRLPTHICVIRPQCVKIGRVWSIRVICIRRFGNLSSRLHVSNSGTRTLFDWKCGVSVFHSCNIRIVWGFWSQSNFNDMVISIINIFGFIGLSTASLSCTRMHSPTTKLSLIEISFWSHLDRTNSSQP